MSTRYLILPRLSVQHANAVQTWWLVGPPSPMSIQGFSRALTRACDFSSDAFSIVHHTVDWLGAKQPDLRAFDFAAPTAQNPQAMRRVWLYGDRILPQQVQGASYIDQSDHLVGKFSKGLQPTMRCHALYSVVLRVPGGRVDLSRVRQFLHSARLAGGSVTEHDDVVLVDTAEDVARYVRGGFYVADQTQWLANYMKETGARSAREALFDLLLNTSIQDRQKKLSPKTDEQEDSRSTGDEPETSNQTATKSSNWRSASVVGYTTLETPSRNRLGVRQDLPHAYAEALVGLIQYQPLKDVTVPPFWSYQANSSDGFFVVSDSAFSLSKELS